LREGEGVAARVLKSLEVDIERTRNEILKELDPELSLLRNRSRKGGGGGEPRSKKDVKTPRCARLAAT
jgi:ATP-dependent Clp protease ATP-binding subunit ClpC